LKIVFQEQNNWIKSLRFRQTGYCSVDILIFI